MRKWFRGFDRRRAVLAATGVLLVLGAAPGAAEAANSDALVLGDPGNRILDQLHADTNLGLVDRGSPDEVDPENFGTLVFDGGQLGPRGIENRPAIESFVGSGEWVVAFDLSSRDLEAIGSYTGLATADRPSEMLMFRVGREQGSPMIEVVNAGPPGVESARKLNERQRDRLRTFDIRQAAAQIAGKLGLRTLESERSRAAYASVTKKVPCAPLSSQPPTDLQHVGWCYTSIGSEVPPNGEWVKQTWWVDKYPNPGLQTASWTMNHRFDVFLSNDKDHPKGNFQTITYGLDAQVAPRRDTESFFRMFDKFHTGWSPQNRVVERAWWTGRLEPSVRPATSTRDKLILEGSHPQSPNSQTSYTAGEDFSVGFSGTAAKPDGGLGIGINLSHSFSNSKSYTVDDWQAQNKTSGRDLAWSFSSRKPCDTRAGNEGEDLQPDCFTTTTPPAPYTYPALPNEISRTNLDVKASGRWRTEKLVEPAAPAMSFQVATPIRLIDTFCSQYWSGNGFCPGSSFFEMTGYTTGPKQETIEVNADWVDPIDIADFKLSKSKATPTPDKPDRVTGTVTLRRAANVPVDVKVISRNPNAVLADPFPGVSDGSQDTVTIAAGQKEGKFTIYTNANRLSPGESTTALINAFYTERAQPQELQVERPR